MISINYEDIFLKPTMLGKNWKSNSSFVSTKKQGEHSPPLKRPSVLNKEEHKVILESTNKFYKYFNY